MSRVARNLGRSRGARRFAIALTITAMALVACGGDDADTSDTTARPSAESDSSVSPGVGGEEILILTRVTFFENEVVATAEILDGSTVGDTQSGPWQIVSGTGAYEGWQGSGQMEAKYDRDNDTKARETYTGNIAQ